MEPVHPHPLHYPHKYSEDNSPKKILSWLYTSLTAGVILLSDPDTLASTVGRPYPPKKLAAHILRITLPDQKEESCFAGKFLGSPSRIFPKLASN